MPKLRISLSGVLLIACLVLAACSVDEPATPTGPESAAEAAVKGDPPELTAEAVARLLRAYEIQQWEELVFTLMPPRYLEQQFVALWDVTYPVTACIVLDETTDLGDEVFTIKVRVPALGTIPQYPPTISLYTLFEIEGVPPAGEILRVGLSPTPWNYYPCPYWIFQLVDQGQGYQPTVPQRQMVTAMPWLRPQFTVDITDDRTGITRGGGMPDKGD